MITEIFRYIMKQKSLDMWKIWLSLIMSCIAMLLAGFAVFNDSFDLGSESFPLGVLSLLVTVLVGWQIYQSLYQKETVRSLIEVEMCKARREIIFHKNNAVFVALGQLGLALYNAGDYGGAVQAYFNALSNWEDEMGKETASKEGYDVIIKHLKELNLKIEKTGGSVSNSNLKSSIGFLQIATRIGDKDIIALALKFYKTGKE